MGVEGGINIWRDIYLDIWWNETYMSRWYQYLALPGRRNPIPTSDKQQPGGKHVLLPAVCTLPPRGLTISTRGKYMATYEAGCCGIDGSI